MLCILKMDGSRITGWIIATNLQDAIRRSEAAWESELALELKGFHMGRGSRQELLGGKYLVLGQ